MSVTAHFVGEDFVLRSLLLDFIPMNKAHSGTYLAECFLRSVEVFGLEKRIGTLTMDNASNNQKMHKALQVELGHKGIKFELNQALPCFDHIINLAVQDFIKVLEPKRKSKEINGRDKPLQEDQELDEEDLDEAEEELDEAEAEGWIHSLRKLLYSIKNSPTNMEKLHLNQVLCGLPKRKIEMDVKTRWNSLFYMLRWCMNNKKVRFCKLIA
jgi:hypothetical protein